MRHLLCKPRFVGCLLLVLFGAHSGYGHEKKLERLTLATTTVGLGRVPMLVAKEMRLFEKYSLDASIVYIRGASTSLQSLLAAASHWP